MGILALLTNWVVGIVSLFGWPGVMGMMFLGSATIPIPSWAVMPFGGYLVTVGTFSFPTLILASTTGSLAGAFAAYALGYWGQDNLVKKLINKYGRYVFVSLKDLERVEKWFSCKGTPIAFFSQLIPVVRAFAGLAAGLVQMPTLPFVIYSLAGMFVWNLGLGYLGYKLGVNWGLLKSVFDHSNRIVVMIGGIVAVFIGYKIYLKKKKKNKPLTA